MKKFGKMGETNMTKDEAKQKLIDAKPLLKVHFNPNVYLSFKEALRILRKMKYDLN